MLAATTTIKPTVLRAAMLVRLSTQEQAAWGKAGSGRQYAQCRKIMESKGYQLAATFEIIDVSGSAIQAAPEFQKLISMVENREIDVLVASELSRVARPDSLESLAIFDVFRRNRCLIATADLTIDFASPEGFLSGGLHALLAGHEKMQFLKKIWESKECNRRKGWLTSSYKTLPKGVGYSKDRKEFFYNEDIPLVCEAFRRVDEDGERNLSEIARLLGVTHKSSKPILSNEIYLGYRVYKEKSDPDIRRLRPGGRQGRRPQIARDPSEIIRVKVIEAGAVSPERFARVQTALKELRYNHVNRTAGVRKRNLLSGLARCGICGEPLYVMVNGKIRKDGLPPFGYYACKSLHPAGTGSRPKCGNSRVRREKIDTLMMAFCRDVLFREEILLPLIVGAASRRKEIVYPFPAQDVAHSLAKLKRRDERIISMCEGGAISIQELQERRGKIRQEIAQLETIAANQAPARGASLEVRELAVLLVRGLSLFSSRLAEDTPQRKAMLQQIFRDVFFRGEILTAFRFADSFVANLCGNAAHLAEVITLAEPFSIKEAISPGQKKCRRCLTVKPCEAFYKIRGTCRRCLAEIKKSQSRRRRLVQGESGL